MTVNETLSQLGLNQKEIRVYTTLLKVGRMTPAAISRLTKINRATVYNIAKCLVTKGFIAEDLGSKTRYLSPLPAESMRQITEKQKREMAEKEKLVKELMGQISLMAKKDYPVPKIRFVEEGELRDFLYDNFIKWQTDLMKKDFTWWGFQDHSLVEHYEDWILWTWKQKEYQDPRCHAHLFSNDSTIEKKLEKKLDRSKRDIRFAKGMDFTSSVWIGGDYVIMTVARQHPFYLVEIHDATLAHNLRQVFRNLWEKTYGPVGH